MLRGSLNIEYSNFNWEQYFIIELAFIVEEPIEVEYELIKGFGSMAIALLKVNLVLLEVNWMKSSVMTSFR